MTYKYFLWKRKIGQWQNRKHLKCIRFCGTIWTWFILFTIHELNTYEWVLLNCKRKKNCRYMVRKQKLRKKFTRIETPIWREKASKSDINQERERKKNFPIEIGFRGLMIMFFDHLFGARFLNVTLPWNSFLWDRELLTCEANIWTEMRQGMCACITNESSEIISSLKSKWLIDWQVDANLEQNYYDRTGSDVTFLSFFFIK